MYLFYSIWTQISNKLTKQRANISCDSIPNNSINFDIYQMSSAETNVKETGLPTYEEVSKSFNRHF